MSTPDSSVRETGRDNRFIAYDNGTVLDILASLTCAAKDSEEENYWQEAKSYCEKYRGGGYTDWRMPTQDELAGLYAGRGYEDKIKLHGDFVWASETDGSFTATFHFNNGARGWGSQSSHFTRALPVRSGK